jgi:hypothetical protein
MLTDPDTGTTVYDLDIKKKPWHQTNKKKSASLRRKPRNGIITKGFKNFKYKF